MELKLVNFMIPFYGLRSRKNCALFVAGRITDLLVPSSVMLAALVTQLAGGASAPTCSNVKLAVSADGQETIFPLCGMLERWIESVGRASR